MRLWENFPRCASNGRAEGLEFEFLEQGIAVGAIVGSAKKIVEPTSGRQALRQSEPARTPYSARYTRQVA